MNGHDRLQLLYDCYPGVIEMLPETFNSHKFILKLAWCHQILYVEALHAHLDAGQGPFQAVHAALAAHLNDCPLVESTGEYEPSEDIFRNSNKAMLWRKV